MKISCCPFTTVACDGENLKKFSENRQKTNKKCLGKFGGNFFASLSQKKIKIFFFGKVFVERIFDLSFN